MSKRTRILVGIVAVYIAAVVFLLYRISLDIDPRYRESAEESLVDTANVLATLLERQAYNGVIQTDELERTLQHVAKRPLKAKIFAIEKTAVVLHVYVTDAKGIVLFDSAARDIGRDFSGWIDVRRTLDGEYGARTTLADLTDSASGVMYVGAAIRERASPQAPDQIVGMLSVGKPISSFSPFVTNARQKLLAAGVFSVASFALLQLIVTVWLVRPFGLITDLWEALRSRRGGAGRVLNPFRVAFADIRDALTGKSYVEEYVATLTHEIKSPLAAIRGAAELLRDPLPENARVRFTSNIEEQVARAQDMVDRMLELSSLERRAVVAQHEPLSVAALADAVRAELAPVAAQRGVELFIDVDPELEISGDRFLLQRSLANLVSNAIDFAPGETAVTVDAQAARGRINITVRDHGAGLPPYAQERAFEKFFSTPRPNGKKGTGLGLAFVREVAQLHGGQVRLINHADGGAVATLSLPQSINRSN